MNKFLKAPWPFAMITLPLALLELSGLYVYTTLQTSLEERSVYYFTFGAVIALFTAASAWYSVRLWRQKEEFPLPAAYLSLAVFAAFSYIFMVNYHHFRPGWEDRWMLSEVGISYQWLFLFPVVFYPLVVIVLHHIRRSEPRFWKISTGLIVGVPLFWYLFFTAAMPLLRHLHHSKLQDHIIAVSAFVSIVLFAYGLMYVLYLSFQKMITNPSDRVSRVARFLRAFYSIVAPAGCFLVYGVWFSNDSNPPLGRLDTPLFFFVALANGVMLLLPHEKYPQFRMALFLGKITVLPVVTYFTLAIFPYLPFAPLAIILYGLGLLMMAPPILLFIQTKSLFRDYRYLKETLAPKAFRNTLAASALLFLLAPSLVLGSFLSDQAVLNKMMQAAYFYHPDSVQEEIASQEKIDSVLSRIWSTKNRWMMRGEKPGPAVNQPILSSLYSKIVLNSLTISDARFAQLEQIFLGKSLIKVRPPRDLAPSVPEIKTLSQKSRLSKDKNYIISQVDLQIQNPGNRADLEFHSEFDLPPLSWITNYYLYVDKQKKEGLLTPKKAALWIYNQIVQRNRDPGILFYKESGLIGFHVFPFGSHETRKTGFEIIHREPFTLKIGGRSIPLGYELNVPRLEKPLRLSPEAARHSSYYISKEHKATLPMLRRTPYLHFLIDASVAATPEVMQSRLEQMDNFLNQQWITVDQKRVSVFDRKISLVNDHLLTFSKEEFERLRDGLPAGSGGFFLERALKTELLRQWQKEDESYPVFIVVSAHPESAVMLQSFAGLRQLFPEGDRYYVLAPNGGLHPFSFNQKPVATPLKSLRNIETPPVYLFDADGHKLFLANTSTDELVLSPGKSEAAVNTGSDGRFQAGLELSAMSREASFLPSPPAANSIMKKSIEAHVMSPYTAFIVLETEAQENVLLLKQKKMLQSEGGFDAGEETAMSEPELWMLLILAIILLLLFKRFTRRHSGRLSLETALSQRERSQ